MKVQSTKWPLETGKIRQNFLEWGLFEIQSGEVFNRRMRKVKSLKPSTSYGQCREAMGKGSSQFSTAQWAKSLKVSS